MTISLSRLRGGYRLKYILMPSELYHKLAHYLVLLAFQGSFVGIPIFFIVESDISREIGIAQM